MENIRTPFVAKIALVVLVFVSSFLAGAYLNSDSPQRYVGSFNVTVDEENSVETVRFRGNYSLDLLVESGKTAEFYVDKDRDGSFDYRFPELERDGNIHSTTASFSFNGTGYDFNFNYRDNASLENDAWLRLTTVEEVR